MKTELPVLLGAGFIALKLCGVIAWSWWWVLSPFWITIVILLALGVCIFCAAVLLE